MAFIPKRYILSLFGFVGVVNAYMMRSCLSVTIIQMVNRPQQSNLFQFSKETFNWSEGTQGLILASFFIGYMVMHIPGAYLAERFGGKTVLNVGLLSTAICTLVTPYVIHTGGSDGLIILRFVMGLGEGPTFPALSTLLSSWIPLKERGKLSSFVFGGGQVGSILAAVVSGEVLAHTKDYGIVFFIFGVLGLGWNILFTYCCTATPETHPSITDEERQYLKREIGELKQAHSFCEIPWSSMLTSGAVWALFSAQIGHDWGFYLLVSDMPKYLSNVLHLSIDEVGMLSALPYMSMWFCSLGSAALGDFLINRNKITITKSRKVFTALAAIIPAILIMGASYSNYEKVSVITCFTIAMGAMGGYYAGVKVNVLDLCPNYSASLMGLNNGLGAFCGFITPYLAGVLTPDATLEEWRIVYWISFGVLAVTTIIYMRWASGEVQSWNDKEEDNWLKRLRTRFCSCYCQKHPENAVTPNQSEAQTKGQIYNENKLIV